MSTTSRMYIFLSNLNRAQARRSQYYVICRLVKFAAECFKIFNRDSHGDPMAVRVVGMDTCPVFSLGYLAQLPHQRCGTWLFRWPVSK